MYTLLLSAHNIVRWLILIAAIVAIGRAVIGWFGKKDWSAADNLAGVIFTGVMDLNVLLGLILYLFLSPVTQAALADFGAAMGNRTLRYFAVEHIAVMLIALVLAHIGRSAAKKATGAAQKHRSAAIWFGLSLLAIVALIPWDRPLWPGLG